MTDGGVLDRVRPEPPPAGTDRELLTAFLDYQRATVVKNVAGLSEDEARLARIPTSPLMTPIGIVRHLAFVERSWFGQDIAGLDLEVPWRGDEPDVDRDADFRIGPQDTLAGVVAFYDAECERSRRIVASMELDVVSTDPADPVTLRWVLIHMVEETARHVGQLDLLRELIDGSVGE